MVSTGKFVFKNITLRGKGSFTDTEGKVIEYDDAYILKVDEIADNGDINERKFKIEKNKTNLISRLKECQPYEDIYLKFELTLYTNRCNLQIIDFSKKEN